MSQMDKALGQLKDLAKKTAQGVNPVVVGTVISRNPDGSLNVDDGKGGCLRRAPSQNVMVGDKVTLGTEPNIGTTTNLDTQYLTLLAPSICPVDDTPPDTETHTPTVTEATENLFAWADKDTVLTTSSSGVPGTVKFTPSFAAAVNSRSVYTAPFGSPLDSFQNNRSYFTIPISATPGAAIVSGGFHSKITVIGHAPVRLHLVASGALNDPVVASDLPLIDFTSLGSAVTPSSVLSASPWTAFDFDLNEDGLDAVKAALPSGFIRVALITQYDLDGTPPPALVPHSLGTFQFYGGAFQVTLGTQPPLPFITLETLGL